MMAGIRNFLLQQLFKLFRETNEAQRLLFNNKFYLDLILFLYRRPSQGISQQYAVPLRTIIFQNSGNAR